MRLARWRKHLVKWPNLLKYQDTLGGSRIWSWILGEGKHHHCCRRSADRKSSHDLFICHKPRYLSDFTKKRLRENCLPRVQKRAWKQRQLDYNFQLRS